MSSQSSDMYQLREGIGRMTEKVLFVFFTSWRTLTCQLFIKLYLVFLQISNVASGVLSTIQVQ